MQATSTAPPRLDDRAPPSTPPAAPNPSPSPPPPKRKKEPSPPNNHGPYPKDTHGTEARRYRLQGRDDKSGGCRLPPPAAAIKMGRRSPPHATTPPTPSHPYRTPKRKDRPSPRPTISAPPKNAHGTKARRHPLQGHDSKDRGVSPSSHPHPPSKWPAQPPLSAAKAKRPTPRHPRRTPQRKDARPRPTVRSISGGAAPKAAPQTQPIPFHPCGPVTTKAKLSPSSHPQPPSKWRAPRRPRDLPRAAPQNETGGPSPPVTCAFSSERGAGAPRPYSPG